MFLLSQLSLRNKGCSNASISRSYNCKSIAFILLVSLVDPHNHYLVWVLLIKKEWLRESLQVQWFLLHWSFSRILWLTKISLTNFLAESIWNKLVVCCHFWVCTAVSLEMKLRNPQKLSLVCCNPGCNVSLTS